MLCSSGPEPPLWSLLHLIHLHQAELYCTEKKLNGMEGSFHFFLTPDDWIRLRDRVYCFLVIKSCSTACDPMDCNPPVYSVHGISQARILEWVAFFFSRGSSQPRDQTCGSCICRWILYYWASREAHSKYQAFWPEAKIFYFGTCPCRAAVKKRSEYIKKLVTGMGYNCGCFIHS